MSLRRRNVRRSLPGGVPAALLLATLAVTVPQATRAQRASAESAPVTAQQPRPLARMPNGKPDLSGIWSIAAGLGDISANIVSVGGAPVDGDRRTIPYTPVYAELHAQTGQRMFEEPELHCYMSGVPSHMWRQAYSGAGLVIQQTDDFIVFLHEFQGSRRIVPLDGRGHVSGDLELFMGSGVGRWDGDTLVVETTNNNAITWLDNGGNRHSDKLIVTERFTPIDNDAYRYEATFEDPGAYTSAWTIAAPMKRGNDPNAEILEFACIEGNTDQLNYTEDVGGTHPAAPSAAPEIFHAPPSAGGRPDARIPPPLPTRAPATTEGRR